MSSFKSPSSTLPQRSSPFRRPASPSSPASHSSGRPSTPPSSRVGVSPMTSPSKLKQSYTVSEEEEDESMITTPTKLQSHISTPTFKANTHTTSPQTSRTLPSPSKQASPFTSKVGSSAMMGTDPLGRLPPALLHSLRESFAVLDASSTGMITPNSANETLQSLGLDTSLIQTLFPPGSNHSITLPQYLNQLASVLVDLSPPQELLNAFSAFDDDDSGQVDTAELRRALLTTPPDAGERMLSEKDLDQALSEFTGRRILGRSAVGMSAVRGLNTPASSRKNGDVFRYQEFVGSLMGPGLDGQQAGQVINAR